MRNFVQKCQKDKCSFELSCQEYRFVMRFIFSLNIIPWSCFTDRRDSFAAEKGAFVFILFVCLATQIGQSREIKTVAVGEVFVTKIIQHILRRMVFRHGQLSCLTRVLKLYIHTNVLTRLFVEYKAHLSKWFPEYVSTRVLCEWVCRTRGSIWIQTFWPTDQVSAGRSIPMGHVTCVTDCVWLIGNTPKKYNRKFVLYYFFFSLPLYFRPFVRPFEIKSNRFGRLFQNFHIFVVHKRIDFSATRSLPLKSQAWKFFFLFHLVNVPHIVVVRMLAKLWMYAKWKILHFVSKR